MYLFMIMLNINVPHYRIVKTPFGIRRGGSLAEICRFNPRRPVPKALCKKRRRKKAQESKNRQNTSVVSI